LEVFFCSLLAAFFVVWTVTVPTLAADRGVSSSQPVGAGFFKRIALVIGNSAYGVSPLRNPVNDAHAIFGVLQKLGFEVTIGDNLSLAQMKRLVWRFGDKLNRGVVGLFYYAGHGVQVAGLNYLIPIGAHIEGERDVELEALDVRYVLAEMHKAKNSLNLVFLDACRDNPYSHGFRSLRKGLASMNAPTGTLISFATGPGMVAVDGTGKHGVFTEELIKYMQIPGLSIERVLKLTRTAVIKRTGSRQIPWESSSLNFDLLILVIIDGSFFTV
jgi:uncharacterized caspase-like protein